MAARVQAHDHAHGEPVLAGAKRADVVGQALGKHGDHAVDKIGRAGPALGLVVDGGVGAHVVRDVGDVNAELVAAPDKAPRAHGVVKVSCVHGVNGYAELAAQVAPARVRSKRSLDIRHDLLGLLLYRAGEVAGQPVARHDGLDLEVELSDRAHTSLNRHHRRARARWVLRDARDHDIALANAQARGTRVLRHDKEVVADARVERGDGAKRSGLGEGAQKGLHGARDDRAHHGARRRAATLHERNLDFVPVHCLALAVAHEVERPLGRLHEGGTGAGDHERARERARVPARPAAAPASPVAAMWAPASHAPPFFSPSALLPLRPAYRMAARKRTCARVTCRPISISPVGKSRRQPIRALTRAQLQRDRHRPPLQAADGRIRRAPAFRRVVPPSALLGGMPGPCGTA